METHLGHLTKQMLDQLEITVLGDQLSILNLKTSHTVSSPLENTERASSSHTKASLSHVPVLKAQMTGNDFCRFEHDWISYIMKIYNPINTQIPHLLYQASENIVKDMIIHNIPEFAGIRMIYFKVSGPWF